MAWVVAAARLLLDAASAAGAGAAGTAGETGSLSDWRSSGLCPAEVVAGADCELDADCTAGLTAGTGWATSTLPCAIGSEGTAGGTFSRDLGCANDFRDCATDLFAEG